MLRRHPRAARERRFRTFVTDGIERALAQAQEAAGGKRIGLTGGDVGQQCLAAGLVDEIRVHVVNLLLGVSETSGAAHLEYRVLR